MTKYLTPYFILFLFVIALMAIMPEKSSEAKYKARAERMIK